jgi:hypothetical protein
LQRIIVVGRSDTGEVKSLALDPDNRAGPAEPGDALGDGRDRDDLRPRAEERPLLVGLERRGRFYLDQDNAAGFAAIVRRRWEELGDEGAAHPSGEPILVRAQVPTSWRLRRRRSELTFLAFRPAGGGREQTLRFERGEMGAYDVTELVRAA